MQVLHELERFFECGQVGRNGRHDKHRDTLRRFCVRRLVDLSEANIPFFEEHPLKTAKADHFVRFAKVVRPMLAGRHLMVSGLSEVALLASQMNQ